MFDMEAFFDTSGWTGFKRVAVKDDAGWRWFSPPIQGNHGNLAANVLELWLTLARQTYADDGIVTIAATLSKQYDDFDMTMIDSLRRYAGDQKQGEQP